MHPSLAGRLASLTRELWNHYGPTETTIAASTYRVLGDERVFRLAVPLMAFGSSCSIRMGMLFLQARRESCISAEFNLREDIGTERNLPRSVRKRCG